MDSPISETPAAVETPPQEPTSESPKPQESASGSVPPPPAPPAQESPSPLAILDTLTEADLLKHPKWGPQLQSLRDKARHADQLKTQLGDYERRQRELERQRQAEAQQRWLDQLEQMEPDQLKEQIGQLRQQARIQQQLQAQFEPEIRKAQSEAYQQAIQEWSRAVYEKAQALGITPEEVQQKAREVPDGLALVQWVMDEGAERKAAKRAEELAAKRLAALENDRRAKEAEEARGPTTAPVTSRAPLDFSRMTDEEFRRYQQEYEADRDRFVRKLSRGR